MSFSWENAAKNIQRKVSQEEQKPPLPPGLKEEQDIEGNYQRLDAGQRASLMWMADRFAQQRGLVLADEVGTGKTRIASAVVHAVLEAGGRAAVVVPHGLMHQWQQEAHILSMPPAKSFTSVRDFIEDAKLKVWGDIAPSLGVPEWLLVSHGFRAPQVRQGKRPAEWRVALPSYVRAELTAQATRDDRRTFSGRLLEDPHETTQRIAVELTGRVRGQERAKLRARLDQLPPFRRDGDNWRLIEALKDESRFLVEELFGLWLAEFDILIVDEAHKSRGEMDVEGTALGAVSGTVLARLIDALLKQPEWGRRLCLTATPMELELSQWLDLLGRARSGLHRERGSQVVKRLHDAAERAAVAPDEGSRLDELCAAAKDFTKTLAPFVTRRRRDEDPLIKRFRTSAALPDGLPHPHRRLRCVQIGWSETVGRNSPWFDVLFAAECMSQSARGLTLKDTEGWPRAVRDAYTKLSAGHVSIDLLETSEPLRVPEPGVVDDYTRGKITRTAYWYRRLRDGRKRVLEGLPPVSGAEFNPDAEHPRILAAVKEIERWTLKREKVLVFGVFLRPLRLLRDVLNLRHALRAADAGRPIAHAVHTDAALLGIALRQLERLRSECALSGRLAAGNGTEMRRALADSHKAYERLRRQVRERAKKPVIAWRTDSTLLGGAPVDRALEGALEDHLVSFVLDDILATTSKSDELTQERFDALTSEFVEERLRPLLGELGDEDIDKEQAVLRQQALRALLEDDDGRQSLHARLLQGATRWETRRYLQAAFNRSGASPWILIAQSQVGREGLNLHESCCVVVQFHAEWNPAVLEQQIGRVDRKGSLWERRAQKWLEDGAQGEPPYIEVRQLLFEGTYDSFQWDRVMRRQHAFDASLFGSLMPPDALERVPEERKKELLDAAPSFHPPRRWDGSVK
jgi:hypothetical protein